MGIFDDAIREHLDLKRRQGADESELQQLEDEAFGLPARPGDPDFPETGEAVAEGAAPAEQVPVVAEQPSLEVEEMEAPAPDETDQTPPHGDALLADPDAEPEPPADEGPVEDAGAGDFSTAEREAIADQPTEFFDQAPEPLDLGELDLDLKDELDEVGELEEEPLTGEELVEEAEPEGEAEPLAEPEPVDEPEEPSASEAGEAEDAQEAEEAEDVLEETPEFLRDNPDDDELWFEQGEPKDFDF
jgi:hypothetical protein